MTRKDKKLIAAISAVVTQHVRNELAEECDNYYRVIYNLVYAFEAAYPVQYKAAVDAGLKAAMEEEGWTAKELRERGYEV